jgi:hypothetical protein
MPMVRSFACARCASHAQRNLGIGCTIRPKQQASQPEGPPRLWGESNQWRTQVYRQTLPSRPPPCQQCP